MNFCKSIKLFIILVTISFCSTIFAAAQPPLVEAKAACLMEEETGIILYEKNMNERLYPASTTKILTCMVLLDYFSPDEIVVVGNEIKQVPLDSSKAGHVTGETITIRNLIRGLLIRSGNDSSYVAAMAVFEKENGSKAKSYKEAESFFAKLMNDKAALVGCKNSNFINPHGYHDENHYTTAYDMALIAKASKAYDLIREIAIEKEYAGYSTEQEIAPEGIINSKFSWKTHNFLIDSKNYYYEHATGLKTGYTSQAGECLAATATKNRTDLICVVLFDPEPNRWIDTIALFEYGFDNFDYIKIQTENEKLAEMRIIGQKLGSDTSADIMALDMHEKYMKIEDVARIEKEITYLPDILTENEDGVFLTAPFNAYDIIGKVSYTLDGTTIYEGDVYVNKTVEKRTFKSDTAYAMSFVRTHAFSVLSIPFWVGFFLIIYIIVLIVLKLKRRKKYFTMRKRGRFR